MINGLKILHVWDVAGVASILSRYQRLSGNTSHVLMAYKSKYDPFSITSFYGNEVLESRNKFDFTARALKQARGYDIIHLHSMWKIAPFFRLKYPDKVIVMHWHGTDIRGRLPYYYNILRQLSIRSADVHIAATRDLLQYFPRRLTEQDHLFYLPNPIDREHFKEMRVTNDRAFTFAMSYLDNHLLSNYLKDNGWSKPYDVIDRDKTPIPYKSLPDVASNYSTYIDIKIQKGKPLEALSKTALEMLSMGRTVLNYKMELIKTFPQEHDPDHVNRTLYEIYRKAQEKRKG